MPRRRGSDRQAMKNAAKTLLANIRFTAIDKPIKTLTITSTRPNEGKTFVACALAEAASTSGRHVLLVECDMRHRSLGNELDIHGSRGMYSVLSGHHRLEDVIAATRQQNLDFLDVEPGIPNPPDVIASKRFRRLVHDLRQDYDLVIFDTPPVGAFVDAAELSALTDGTLFVVRENFTKRDIAIDALEQLRKAGANVLGTVLNGCETTSTGYYDYYYREGEKPVEDMPEVPLDALPREGHVRTGDASGSVPVISPASPREQAPEVAAPVEKKPAAPASGELGKSAAGAAAKAPAATSASASGEVSVPAVPAVPAAAAAAPAAKKPSPSETAAFVIAAQQSAQARASQQHAAASSAPAAAAPSAQAAPAPQRQSGYRGVTAAQQRGAAAQTAGAAASQGVSASAVPVVPVMHGSASASSKTSSAARQAGPYVPPKNNPYAR